MPFRVRDIVLMSVYDSWGSSRGRTPGRWRSSLELHLQHIRRRHILQQYNITTLIMISWPSLGGSAG